MVLVPAGVQRGAALQASGQPFAGHGQDAGLLGGFDDPVADHGLDGLHRLDSRRLGTAARRLARVPGEVLQIALRGAIAANLETLAARGQPHLAPKRGLTAHRDLVPTPVAGDRDQIADDIGVVAVAGEPATVVTLPLKNGVAGGAPPTQFRSKVAFCVARR